MEKLQPLHIASGDAKWHSLFGNSMTVPQKFKHSFTIWLRNFPSNNIVKKNDNISPHTHTLEKKKNNLYMGCDLKFGYILWLKWWGIIPLIILLHRTLFCYFLISDLHNTVLPIWVSLSRLLPNWSYKWELCSVDTLIVAEQRMRLNLVTPVTHRNWDT